MIFTNCHGEMLKHACANSQFVFNSQSWAFKNINSAVTLDLRKNVQTGMQLVHCNNLYEEFETNTVFSVNMFVPVYNKKAIFFGCKCAVLIFFILIFFLYFIYQYILLKAKIINFITYTDISADHITTEFIIIKLIFESKNVKEPYNWYVLVFQYGDAIDFSIAPSNQIILFFHERKMFLFLY